MTNWRKRSAALGLVLGLSIGLGSAGAQSLAHRGWAGNGIAVTPWWHGAEFAEWPATASGGLEDAEYADRLDELRALGVDALVVPAGMEDAEYDRLVREATSRRLRIVVDLALEGSEAEVTAHARAWLNRGVAGLRLTLAGVPPSWVQARLALAAERVVQSFAGQRVVLWNGPASAAGTAPASARRRGRAAPVSTVRVAVDHWLSTWPNLDAAGLRQVLTLEAANSGARVLDGADLRPALLRAGAEGATAKRVAAAMLLGGEAPVLYAGEQGSGELAEWHRRLGEIRHGSVAVREGTLQVLDLGDASVVAWVWRGRAGGVATPALVVAINFDDRPVRITLDPALRRLGVPFTAGTLRILAVTGQPGGEAASAESVGIEPGGVFVGEVKGPAGLEAAPEPVRRRRR